MGDCGDGETARMGRLTRAVPTRAAAANGVRLRAVGDRAVLAEFGPDAGPGAALDLARWLREQEVPALDVVPGACTVLIDGLPEGARAEVEVLVGQWHPGRTPVPGPLVWIDVDYRGPDLLDVARIWGCSPEEVVTRHTSIEFTAAFTGFAPGFAYLSGLPEQWRVPRLATPRTRVEPGSVGLADTWSGVYPSASPGGWRILGVTSATLWDAGADSPALLAPGTRVRFRPLTRQVTP